MFNYRVALAGNWMLLLCTCTQRETPHRAPAGVCSSAPRRPSGLLTCGVLQSPCPQSSLPTVPEHSPSSSYLMHWTTLLCIYALMSQLNEITRLSIDTISYVMHRKNTIASSSAAYRPWLGAEPWSDAAFVTFGGRPHLSRHVLTRLWDWH